jgi:hypothetical protein
MLSVMSDSRRTSVHFVARETGNHVDLLGAASFGISVVVRLVSIGMLSSLTAARAAAIDVWDSLWRPQSLL